MSCRVLYMTWILLQVKGCNYYLIIIQGKECNGYILGFITLHVRFNHSIGILYVRSYLALMRLCRSCFPWIPTVSDGCSVCLNRLVPVQWRLPYICRNCWPNGRRSVAPGVPSPPSRPSSHAQGRTTLTSGTRSPNSRTDTRFFFVFCFFGFIYIL